MQKIEVLQLDNAKEFESKALKEYCKLNNIMVQYSVPYYHQSNGRVLRLKGTILTGLKKAQGSINNAVVGVIQNYNNMIHRGIKMSPNDAMKSENHDKVLKNMDAYCKEFKTA